MPACNKKSLYFKKGKSEGFLNWHHIKNGEISHDDTET